MTHHIYTKFKEIEHEVKRDAPPYIYKYRTWNNDFHKRLLSHREAWFAHPFTLNDPNDVRRPYAIDTSGYQSERMFWKLYQYGRYNNRLLNELQLAKEIGFRWQQIQRNPEGYFRQNNLNTYNDYNFYSGVGIFSTCQNGLSSKMWASEEYSDNHKGYCLGFKTVELARDLQFYIGKVRYTDDDLIVKVIDGFTDKHSREEVLLKYTKWSYEEEFRFIVYSIENNKRKRFFSRRAVSEVIIGRDASDSVKNEIISITQKVYKNIVPIFQIISLPDGTLQKIKI